VTIVSYFKASSDCSSSTIEEQMEAIRSYVPTDVHDSLDKFCQLLIEQYKKKPV